MHSCNARYLDIGELLKGTIRGFDSVSLGEYTLPSLRLGRDDSSPKRLGDTFDKQSRDQYNDPRS